MREEWAAITTTLDVASPAERTRVAIGSPLAAPNECVFIDDVRVEKQP